MWRNSFRKIQNVVPYLYMMAGVGLASPSAHADEGRGQRLFHLCKSCHGEQGEGKESLGAPAIAGMPAWHIEAQLTKFATGVRGLHPRDDGGMKMRPMARTMNGIEDFKAVAAYTAKLPPAETPQTVKGNIALGEEQYLVCSTCHGADGMGNKDLNAPPLVNQSDWYLLIQLQHFKTGVRAGDPTKDVTGAAMAPMAALLDDEGMKNVLSYIHALK